MGKLDELMSRRDGPELIGTYLLLAGDVSARDPGAATLMERVLWVGLIDFVHDPAFLQDQVFGMSVMGLVGELVRFALSMWILYYVVASLRHFYEDSWMRTLFKASLLTLLYMVLVTPVYFATVALRM